LHVINIAVKWIFLFLCILVINMTMPSVFISFNPNSDIEQTLAIRLNTIGAVHGFNMLLPDRSPLQKGISIETKSRILLADYFILFSTSALSKEVLSEIEVAYSKLQDKTKILVVYDKRIGKNVSGLENCTEVYIDLNADVPKILSEILNQVKFTQNGKHDSPDWSWIILTGLGLFALASIIEPGRKRKKNIPPKKTLAKKKAVRSVRKVKK
jgi:hypothetical protein